MTNITKLSDLNDYLIFNLNREDDPEKKMKLKYKIPLKFNEEKSNREYHYQFIERKPCKQIGMLNYENPNIIQGIHLAD